MMEHRSQWSPWYVTLVTAAVVAPFFSVFFVPGEKGAAIAKALTVPSALLVVQMAFNKRRMRVYPDRVVVAYLPVPLPLPWTIPRAEITRCVVEHQRGSVKSGIRECYYVGVRTTGGELCRVTGELPNRRGADHLAAQAVAILNSAPGAVPIGVGERTDEVLPKRGFLLLVMFYFVFWIGAVLLGGYLELTRNQPSPDPRKLEMPL